MDCWAEVVVLKGHEFTRAANRTNQHGLQALREVFETGT
jgi:hypothetical protein